jgi:peptidoglycan hydrolase CwlO-like protein
MKNPMLELLKVKTIKTDLESISNQIEELDMPDQDKQKYLTDVDELIQKFNNDLCGIKDIIETNI